jgi:predicted DsbA family dithiol-disulfide isomerase
VEEELGDDVHVEWRSFLLRPHPDPDRTLERFRAYTHSWMRPAAEADGGTFCVWEGDAGPPSHSVPPHLVAKAAATLGHEAFQRMHERLLRAYFAERRDITDFHTLHELWRDAELPEHAFARASDPVLVRAVTTQHNEAVERGITGVPAVMMVGNDVPIVGAQATETYRRWVRRALDGRLERG